MMSNEQAALLYEIQALDFALVDLCLYLDTHPFDQEAIALFQQYAAECEKRVCEYEKRYQPITIKSCEINHNEWHWATTQWPWENKEKSGGVYHVVL